MTITQRILSVDDFDLFVSTWINAARRRMSEANPAMRAKMAIPGAIISINM